MVSSFPGMSPTAFQMQNAIYGLFRTQALHVAAELGIADRLADAPLGLDELAAATATHAPSLGRLMRFLVAEGVFSDGGDGRYGLTPTGELLRSDHPHSSRQAAIFYGSPAIWSAWGNLGEAIRTGKTAFELAHGQPLFPYLNAHGEDARIFNDFMTEMAARRVASAPYDYSGMNTVVDVGGGQGTSLVEILHRHPTLRGVLFDLPAVVAEAPETLSAAGVDDRCEVKGGDFFESVPEGGDVYLLSNILHDWEDSRCQQILANCRKAMHAGSRLVVLEAVVPEGPSPILLVDMQMLVVTGGVQRTEREFRALIEPAGFEVTRLVPPGLIEATAV